MLRGCEYTMKIVWAHDHYFLNNKKDNVYYSEVEFPYENWLRYLSSFDEVIVAARIKELTGDYNLEKLNISSGDRVNFIHIPNLNSPFKKLTKYYVAKNILKEALVSSDGLIARLPSEIGLLAIKVAIELGKPWAVELVGCPWDALRNLNNWKAKLYAPYITMKTKKYVRKASHVLYVTKEFLQNRYPTNGISEACSNVNISQVPNSVLDKRLERLNTKRDKVIIGLIGYLSYYKGIDTALNALKIVLREQENIELHILGGGDKQYWINYANQIGIPLQKLCFSRLPSGEPVLNWLDNIDLYIQPSRTEGLPRGLIEAMSRGCPALASNVGGIPELLEKDCLHNPGDSNHLAEMIKRSLKDNNWNIKNSITNFNKAKDYYREILDKKRQNFWREFSIFIKKQKV